MAVIPWPSTLPNPSANGFKFSLKNYATTARFQSGRMRRSPNRANFALVDTEFADARHVISLQLQFEMTFSEYDIFIAFYETYWKTMAPGYANSLSFSVSTEDYPAPYVFDCHPSSEISADRRDNGWSIGFSVEARLSNMARVWAGDVEINNASCPSLPPEFVFASGTSFDRITRDSIAASGDQSLLRIPIASDCFLSSSAKWEMKNLAMAFFFCEWFSNKLFDGQKVFKFDSSLFEVGSINGHNESAWLLAKFVEPPSFSFSGYFGTADAKLIVWRPSVEQSIYLSSPIILDSEYALSWGSLGSDITILSSANILTTADQTIYTSRGVKSWQP